MGIGTLLIRADAGPEIGAGHVMRCLALAQAWQDRGGRVVFAMAESTPGIRARLNDENCEIAHLHAVIGDSQDAAATVSTAREHNAAWIVLDGYAFDSRYQAHVKNTRNHILYVDDLAACDRYHADIVLNPNLSGSESSYVDRAERAPLLVGTRYSLLRREFRRWANWTRTIPPVAGKVLITLGGSTPRDLALRVLDALSQIQSEVENAVFVVGTTTEDFDSLNRAAQSLSEKVTFVRSATDMAALMMQADVAVSAAGSTCWELCSLGLPSLLMDVADNQTAEALELDRRGYAKYVGSAATLRPEKLANDIRELLHSEETRRNLSSKGRELVDGRGAERVVSAMLQTDSPQDLSSSKQEVPA